MDDNLGTYAFQQRINRLLMALSRVNQTILRVREDRAQLLHDACSIIFEQLNYDLVWLGEINCRGEVIRGASQGGLNSYRVGAKGSSAVEMSESTMSSLRNIAIRAARERNDIVQETLATRLQKSTEPQWRASAFPVEVNDNSTFVLVACTHDTMDMEAEEVEILRELAGDLGFAIETMETQTRTQQAEAALRISEERFRRLAENSMAGIVLIQNDAYRYVNPAFAEMFGYASPDDIIDRMGPLDLAAPESRSVVHENVQRRILGQVRSAHYQYRGLRKDGTVFDVEEYGARTIHAQRLAIIATVVDITSREASRHRLEALSKSGLALSAAQTVAEALTNAARQAASILPCDAADIVVFSGRDLNVDVHTHAGATGTIISTMINRRMPIRRIPGFGQILESQRSAIIENVSLAELTPLSESASVHEYAGAPLIVRGELIGFLAAESKQLGRFTDEDAHHLRLLADHAAATLQHLRLISSLEEERNRLQTLNHLSHTLSETLQLHEVASRALGQIGRALHADISLLYLWDQANGKLEAIATEGLPQNRLERLNTKLAARSTEIAEAILGWDKAGRDRHPQVYNKQNPLTRFFAEIYAEGQHDYDSTLDVPLEAHGELIGVLSFLSSMPNGFAEADAELVRALGVQVALAIQNAYFYERAARQAEVMAEALHRQEELDLMKDELIQNISHELRTPLSLVMGYAEMLNSGQLGPIRDEQANAVGVITRRSRMLRSLVEDIALLWQIERRASEKESLDLCNIVATTVAEFTNQAQDLNLTLDSTVPEGPVQIKGVMVQMRRVLDNLVGNSMKFTPAGGEVHVVLEAKNGFAELSVADTGIGVPEEKLQRIFERFYQVDGSPRRKHGGTGLGLALVKAIAEAHQGTIEATSPISNDPQNPGTKILIRIPVTSDSKDPITATD